MQADLGWSRTTLLGALTVATFVSAGVGVFVGPLFDKHGTRLGMSSAALASGVLLLLIPLVKSPWQFYVIVGLGLGATRSILDNIGPRTSIANWFVRKRASAFAWFSAGRAVFGVTAVGPIAFLVNSTSWKSGWLTIGMLEIALLFPLAWVIIRRRPEDHGLAPDGEVRPANPNLDSPSLMREPEWSRATAMRTRTFWLMVIGFFFAGLPATGIIANMLPYFDDQGLSIEAASVAFSLFGAGALVGRPLWGLVASRLGVHAGLTLYGFTYAVSLGLLVLGFGSLTLSTAAFLVGIPTGGAQQLQSQAWPDFFGRRNVGSITGVSTLIAMPAMAFGPLVAALAYDLMGSYTVVFSAFAAATFVSGICFYFARKPSPEQ